MMKTHLNAGSGLDSLDGIDIAKGYGFDFGA